jgi:chaperonin cofactor prefoldin
MDVVLRERLEELEAAINTLRAENRRLRDRTEVLSEGTRRLEKQNESLEGARTTLHQRNLFLMRKVAALNAMLSDRDA